MEFPYGVRAAENRRNGRSGEGVHYAEPREVVDVPGRRGLPCIQDYEIIGLLVGRQEECDESVCDIRNCEGTGTTI